MELTVSVSTVIFLVDPSPEGFPLVEVFVLYAFAGALGRSDVAGAVDRILISPFPPLSLPLSLLVFALVVLPNALSIGLSCSFNSLAVAMPFSAFSRMPSRPNPGVFG
jgi:hypothetical protein